MRTKRPGITKRIREYLADAGVKPPIEVIRLGDGYSAYFRQDLSMKQKNEIFAILGWLTRIETQYGYSERIKK